MYHFFDVNIAKKIGVNPAIILHNIYYWIDHNKKNEKNFYDNNYWTYNSIKAFEKQFPYMSSSQIRNNLKKLIDDGYIITGNYNSSSYDRTMWYAITDKAKALFEYESSICQNQQMDIDKITNGNIQNNKPIPDNNTDNNTNNIKKDISNDISKESELSLNCVVNDFFDADNKSAIEKKKEQYKRNFDYLKEMIGKLYNRRADTEWSDNENTKLKVISKRKNCIDEFESIKKLYESGYEFKRRDAKTLINNWVCEFDRSNDEKNYGRTINANTNFTTQQKPKPFYAHRDNEYDARKRGCRVNEYDHIGMWSKIIDGKKYLFINDNYALDGSEMIEDNNKVKRFRNPEGHEFEIDFTKGYAQFNGLDNPVWNEYKKNYGDMFQW